MSEWDWDKTEFIPNEVVKRLVEKGFGGVTLEREVERVVKQVRSRTGSAALEKNDDSLVKTTSVVDSNVDEKRPPPV